MLIEKDKHPIGYRIFKGDTFDGHTLGAALDDLKKGYDINQVVVAPAGECSAKTGTGKRRGLRVYHRRKNKIITCIRTKVIA